MEFLLLLGLVGIGASIFASSDEGDEQTDDSGDTDPRPTDPGDDVIVLTNLIEGTEGGDLLTGGDANDGVNGGDGDDTLSGAGGDDLIIGGTGDDLADGNQGRDGLLGGSGEDTLRGGAGDDSIYGGVGEDLIEGGADSDVLTGGAGADVLRGEGGNDLLSGYEDSERDEFFEAQDRFDPDTLEGGDGDDVLLMGSGDEAVGGLGNDMFVTGSYVDGTDIPVVEDFVRDEDILTIVVEEGAPGVVSIARGADFDDAIVSVDGVAVAQVEDQGGTLTTDDVAVVEVEFTPVA